MISAAQRNTLDPAGMSLLEESAGRNQLPEMEEGNPVQVMT